MPTFQHHDLALLNPAFDSPLVDVVTELELLRHLRLGGSTPAPLFFQLKHIFHMLESLGSARIEGNHTTLADYVESHLETSSTPTKDALRELANIESAMRFVEDNFKPGQDITEHFIRELHTLAVRELEREGDSSPGAYRTASVQIAQSDHLPPDALRLPEYMSELVTFINRKDAPKYDLLKVALAHHRFVWVHPFSNGNGRTVRLLTYALLIKYDFNVKTGGRVLNPTAVFCNDRNHYYTMLAQADAGNQADLEAWCIYVLSGIRDELRKVDRLTDATYLNERVLTPALHYARERELLTQQEARLLLAAARLGIVKSGDLQQEMPELNSRQRNYQISKLVERHLLEPIHQGARQYTVGFANSFLMRGVIQALSDEGFIPDALIQP